MAILDLLWGNWLIVAFLAPFFWAIMNIIDAYFVSSVYEDEWDGGIISSLFQLSAWLLVVFGLVEFQFPGTWPAFIAITSGILLAFSFFYYFRTLFVSHDVVVIGSIWNLSVPLVPFLAWLIVGERLSRMDYFGIILAFVGATLFVVHKRIREKNLWSVIKNMLFAVTLLSLSMVLQNWVYDHAHIEFWTGFLLFSSGSALAGILMIAIDKRSLKDRVVHLQELAQKHVHIFFFAEFLGLLAILSSQRAISLSPSVSYVAAIESAVPVFVMILSFIFALFLFKTNLVKARQIFTDQLDAIGIKIMACVLIAFGIYLIS